MLVVLALLVIPGMARAQIGQPGSAISYRPGGAGGAGSSCILSGCTMTGPILHSVGSFSAPGVSFDGHATAGVYWDPTGTGYTVYKAEDFTGTNAAGGNLEFDAGGGTGTGAGGTIYFIVYPPSATSGASANGAQVFFQMHGNNDGLFQLGGPQVTSPAASTIWGAWGKSGVSNLAAGDLNLSGGAGTGTGAGGSVKLNLYMKAASSGSTSNSGATTVLKADGNTGDVTLSPATPGGGSAGYVYLTGRAFSTLGSASNGAIAYCSDCTIANPCASGGSGALAKRLNGAWVCN